MKTSIKARKVLRCCIVLLMLANSLFAQKGLFETDDVLSIKLTGLLRPLLSDRTSTAKDFPIVLSFDPADSNHLQIPVQVKTRGNFRRLKENCEYPPLLIQFPKKGAHVNTIFSKQKKMKLVMPCTDADYIVKEWLVYKLYNLVTPYSFRARLVQVTLVEEKNNKTTGPFYGLLVEEEKQMAKRNKMMAIEAKMQPQHMQPDPYLSMAVFQYMIGNTDWSAQFLHNIKLLAEDTLAMPLPVPYDFDHAGIVGAPYALPAEELHLRSTRERLYRGYCIQDLSVFEPVIAQFNSLKKDIYYLYTNCPLLTAKDKRETIAFLDDFFSTINKPKDWQKEFGYPCDKNGTGKVIIKGLKN